MFIQVISVKHEDFKSILVVEAAEGHLVAKSRTRRHTLGRQFMSSSESEQSESKLQCFCTPWYFTFHCLTDFSICCEL